jgi:hypothetical protein
MIFMAPRSTQVRTTINSALDRLRFWPRFLNAIYWREQACKSQIDILSCGRALHVPACDVVEGTSAALSGTEITLHNEDCTNPHVKSGAQKGQSGYGLLEWPALRRRLDRPDPSYAD